MTTSRALERVLVADDFTAGSAAAIARAAHLPLASRAELHLLHVLEPGATGAAGERAMAAVRERLQQRASPAAATARKVSALELSVATHVAQGKPFVEIIRQARALDADLVVVGRHRPRRVRDAFLGSTAERVVRKGDAPVLLVAGAPAGPYRRVVAAVDLGDTSPRVVQLAATLTRDPCTLALVHAYAVPFESEFEHGAGRAATEEASLERREELGVAGTRLLDALKPLGRDCRFVLRKGDPRTVLVREALRGRAELVALGTHARSGVAHALLGSVAEWVIRAAPCDVAITRPARFSFELP